MASKWVKRQFLGRGSYGSVFSASPAAAHSNSTVLPIVAVKSAFINNSASLQLERDVLHELRGCPEIIQCFGEDVSIENGREVYNLLLEYAPGGTLEDVIEFRGGKIPESEVSCNVSMMLKGLSHVHEEGYVHCDMKPGNVLVFQQDDINFLKLADFGLAKKAGRITTNLGFHKNRGALLYSSPESVVFGYHEAPMDIWSLGCIMVEMLLGKRLWSTNVSTEVLELMIASFEEDQFLGLLPEFLSRKAKDFLRRCLTKNVEARWTADQLLCHPFITENVVSLPESCSSSMSYPKSPFEYPWMSEQSMFSATPSDKLPLRFNLHDYICS